MDNENLGPTHSISYDSSPQPEAASAEPVPKTAIQKLDHALSYILIGAVVLGAAYFCGVVFAVLLLI